MHLVQLLLPLYDAMGKPVPKAAFDAVRETLLERHGGLTAYSQSPASGLWKDAEQGDAPVQDVIVVYEVMVDALDRAWWARYRSHLADVFGQKEIVARAHVIETL